MCAGMMETYRRLGMCVDETPLSVTMYRKYSSTKLITLNLRAHGQQGSMEEYDNPLKSSVRGSVF